MSNWRLPSKDELNAMYEQLQLEGPGDFKADSYWSSSESGNNKAWYQNFDYGYQYANDKDYHLWVRLVRSLSEDEINNGLVLSLDGQSFEVAEKDEPKWMTWEEAMEKGNKVEEDSRLKTMTADRDAWKAKAESFQQTSVQWIPLTPLRSTVTAPLHAAEINNVLPRMLIEQRIDGTWLIVQSRDGYSSFYLGKIEAWDCQYVLMIAQVIGGQMADRVKILGSVRAAPKEGKE